MRIKRYIGIKNIILVLTITTAFLFSSCRSVFEFLHMATSNYVFCHDNKKISKYYITLSYPELDSLHVSISLPHSNKLYVNKNPKYYNASLNCYCKTCLPDDFIITYCENVISYNNILNHHNIMYLFNKGYGNYWSKLPHKINGPIYATFDDTTGYREYNSFDRIPLKYRTKYNHYDNLSVRLFYYDIPNDIAELKYHIKLELMKSGKVFVVDTTLNLHKELFKEPILPLFGN